MITRNFSLREATYSQMAFDMGINNTPNGEILKNIKFAGLGMERVRAFLNHSPIMILSWYRCSSLNAAVGGVANSQHIKGLAIDFVCPKYGDVHTVANALMHGAKILGIDQVIKENGRWVHVSFSDDPRYEALTVNNNKTQVGIV